MNELIKTALNNMAIALEGTTISATHYLKNHGLFPLTEAQQEYLDELVFQCPNCGYWCRADDMIDGQCLDCYEEELEEAAEDA